MTSLSEKRVIAGVVYWKAHCSLTHQAPPEEGHCWPAREQSGINTSLFCLKGISPNLIKTRHPGGEESLLAGSKYLL